MIRRLLAKGFMLALGLCLFLTANQTAFGVEPAPSNPEAPQNSYLTAIARVVCYNPAYTRGSPIISGSGSIWQVNGQNWLLTNNHVLEAASAYGLTCDTHLVQDFQAAVDDYEAAIEEDKVLVYEVDPEGFYQSTLRGDDLAFAKVIEVPSGSPLSLLDHVALRPNVERCSARFPIGTPLRVLGYPGIGAMFLPTMTEGIIASLDKEGDVYYYLTSAKIESGNSGGLALTEDLSCVVGIPTYVAVGEVESLGRILVLTEEEIAGMLSSVAPEVGVD